MFSGSRKASGNHAGQTGQRHDIEHVVMKDRDQAEGAARAQVFEVVVRDQFARHVAFALHAEDLVFEIHQAAAFETQLEQAPRAVEQIEMLHAREGMTRAAHRVARFEQRLIEALAVVGDQHVEAGEIRGERVEHGRPPRSSRA